MRYVRKFLRLFTTLIKLCRILPSYSYCHRRGAFVMTAFVALVGCTEKPEFDKDQIANLIPTNLYNYTKSEIFFAAYHNAAAEFNIATAAPAGTTSFQGDPGKDLGSGVVVHADSDRCCFWWRYKENEDVYFRIVWLEIFDSEIYGRAVDETDERSVKRSLPGSQWCEAIVKVNKPYPRDVGFIVFHFMPDGSVEARLAPAGKIDGYEPYSAGKVLKYPVRSDRPVCRHPIANPWYLVPRKPYRE